MEKYHECMNECLESTAILGEAQLLVELTKFGYAPTVSSTVLGLQKVLCNLRCIGGGGGSGESADAKDGTPAEKMDEPDFSLSVRKGMGLAGHTKK